MTGSRPSRGGFGVDYGYDPFGGLIVRCPAAGVFAVAWPVDLNDGSDRDHAVVDVPGQFEVLADGRHRPVPVAFAALEDGGLAQLLLSDRDGRPTAESGDAHVGREPRDGVLEAEDGGDRRA